MKAQIVTSGMVLTRTDFQEADRILTILTPDHGKLRVIAKGVRRPRSKLAGGIELFSVSDITVLPGRGELSTLVSSRLQKHFGNIVKDVNRTMLGYELLKRTNRITEDNAEKDYFTLLNAALSGLDDFDLSAELTELWFGVQLLNITGHLLNLKYDSVGKPLLADKRYVFDFDTMTFEQQDDGPYTTNHIKLLRLTYGIQNPHKLKQVSDAESCAQDDLKLIKLLLAHSLHL